MRWGGGHSRRDSGSAPVVFIGLSQTSEDDIATDASTYAELGFALDPLIF